MASVTPFPGAPPTGGHIIGQPFSVSNLSIPVSALFTCNCVPGNAPVAVVNSAPVTCPACTKTYVLGLNPQTGQLMVGMTEPAAKVEV